MIKNFPELINQWPNMNVLASDLNEKPDTVRKWKQREFIPANQWRALINAAHRRDIAINEVTLVRIAAKS